MSDAQTQGEQEKKSKSQLDDFIKENKETQKMYVLQGLLLILSGVIVTVVGIVVEYNTCSWCCGHPCYYVPHFIISFAMLLAIGGIICIAISNRCNKISNQYRNQLIVLRDLETATMLAKEIKNDAAKEISQIETTVTYDANTKITTTITTPKTVITKEPEHDNAMKEIIETLLNRCSS